MRFGPLVRHNQVLSFETLLSDSEQNGERRVIFSSSARMQRAVKVFWKLVP